MLVIEVADPIAWNTFLASVPRAPFPQSWAWGELRVSIGRKVLRLAVMDAVGNWIAAMQVEQRVKGRGLAAFWFAPRGPIFAEGLSRASQSEAMMHLIHFLQTQDAGRAWFLRAEPFVAQLPDVDLPLTRVSAQNPSTTRYVDLAKFEGGLLEEMHEKTRYNFRLAGRKGVRVRTSTTESDLEIFLRLMNETAERDGFTQHSGNYIRQTWNSLVRHQIVRLRLAEFEGEVLAASLEVLCGDTVTYLYGASSSTQRNMMAPYALHAEAILSAKAEGFRWYDLWGANPVAVDDPDFHPSWEGISRFKSGWGGDLVSYCGTWDIPFRPRLYQLAKMIGGIK